MEKERREVGQEECRREAEGRGRRPLRRLQLRSLRLAGQHWTHEGERRARGLPLPLSHWDLFTCQEDFCRVCGDLPVASDPSSSLPQAPRPYLLHIRLLAQFCHPPPNTHTHPDSTERLETSSVSLCGMRVLAWRGNQVGKGTLSFAASPLPGSFSDLIDPTCIWNWDRA